jgi:hypothetical protein
LESALGRHVGHTRLQWIKVPSCAQLLGGLHHAHIGVLLLLCLDLLLLVLQQLDLLLDGKLFHCDGVPVSNMPVQGDTGRDGEVMAKKVARLRRLYVVVGSMAWETDRDI